LPGAGLLCLRKERIGWLAGIFVLGQGNCHCCSLWEMLFDAFSPFLRGNDSRDRDRDRFRTIVGQSEDCYQFQLKCFMEQVGIA